jgi:hypothetical protein
MINVFFLLRLYSKDGMSVSHKPSMIDTMGLVEAYTSSCPLEIVYVS